MAFCTKCGSEINEGSKFCTKCGAAAPGAAPAEKSAGSVNSAEAVKGAGGANSGGKPPKKKLGKGKLAVIIAAAAVAVALGVSAICLFPLKVSADTGDRELLTQTGAMEKFKVTVRSNQPIRSVSCELKEAGSELEGEAAEPDEISGSAAKKTLTFKKLYVPAGESELTVRVKTLFGEKTCRIKIECDIGYEAAPDEEAMVEVMPGTKLITNELIIVFDEDAERSEIKKLLKKYDGEIVGENYIIGEYQVRFTGSGEDYINELMEQLKAEKIVEEVYFSTSIEAESDYYPNDKKYDSWKTSNPKGNNWGLEAIKAPDAWDEVTGLQTVKVGVIDSSLYYEHEDLQIDPSRIRMLATKDFKSMDDVEDYYAGNVKNHKCPEGDEYCVFCGMKDHGTHCTGIIGARADNSRGVAGVAWNAQMYFATYWYLYAEDNAQMSCADTTTALINNITWMAVNGCRVISISVGDSEPSEAGSRLEQSDTARFDRAIKKLEDAGYDFIICKAAGNENDDAGRYSLNRIMTSGSTARDHVLIVASVQNFAGPIESLAAYIADVDAVYKFSDFSNYGSLIDVAAPGSAILSTVYGDGYESFYGTSMATPMAAGAAALIYGAAPNLTADTVRTIIRVAGNSFAYKDSEFYYMLDADAALQRAHDWGDGLPEKELPNFGMVSGMVQDADTLALIRSAKIYITNEATGEEQVVTASDGNYDCTLPSGTYTMRFEATNYITETVYHVKVEANVVNYNILLNMVPQANGRGTVTGRMVNAFDASSIPGAKIKIYRGVNNTSGSPVQEITSDSSGRYSVDLEPGNYTLYVTAQGYADGTANIISIANKTRDNQDCTLTPNLNAGEMRIVLTWGEYPYDLDSHLTGPTPDGGRFHTYYVYQDYYYSGTRYDNLDVDDRWSYGPETTSVYVPLEGRYVFYVQDFSNRDSGTSSALSSSGAQVKLYMAGWSEPVIYYVPNEAGTLWTVFSVENGVVTPINEMSFHSSPYTIGD